MKRFLAILLFLAFGVSFAEAQQLTRLCYITGNAENVSNCVPGIQASASVPINVAAATTTQLVALVAGQAIYVTSWDAMAAGTNNVTLVYGTGTACGTAQVTLTGAYPFIAQAGISKGNGSGIV